jgi:hypothetical protein
MGRGHPIYYFIWLQYRPVPYQLFRHSDSLSEAYKCWMETCRGKLQKWLSSWKANYYLWAKGWSSLTRYSTIWYCIWFPYCSFVKETYKDWNTSDQDSFRKEIVRRKKYLLAKWNVVYRPKDQGWFCIHDLEVKSREILGKWLFKLMTKDGPWQNILKIKYIGSKALSQVYSKLGTRTYRLALWRQISSSFHMSLSLSRMDHTWCSGKISVLEYALREQYCATETEYFSKGDGTSPPNVTFRQDLIDLRLASRYGLVKAWGRRVSIEYTREWKIICGIHV